MAVSQNHNNSSMIQRFSLGVYPEKPPTSMKDLAPQCSQRASHNGQDSEATQSG